MNRHNKQKPTVSSARVPRASILKDARKPNAHKQGAPAPVTGQALNKKKPILKKNPPTVTDAKKSSGDQLRKRAETQSCRRSSTPLSTPSKFEKNPEKLRSGEKELDALSDISKDSAPSSVCSSVSSGLIELLCHYNAKGENVNVPEKEIAPLDDTLKNKNTFSFVIPTDQPNCDGRIKILIGLLAKLKTTANSILSSGDSRNVKRLEKLIEAMSIECGGLEKELPSLWVQKREFEAEIEAIVSPLKAENAALQRKIRILNQNLSEKEKQNETDLNLALETVQCMNKTLSTQVKKLSSLLQDSEDRNKKLEEDLSSLRTQNRKITEDLVYKNVEFSKSRELFSNEAGSIKSEVASALQKVDVLKDQLRKAETQNELAHVSLQEKDEEIGRLSDLSKGLQSSVSRLLEDLQKARPRLEQASNRKVSSAILRNIDHLLNTPKEKSPDNSFWNESIDYRPNHLTRSYPLPSGKENSSRVIPFMQNPVRHLYENRVPDGYADPLESSRLSSVETSTFQSSVIESASTGMRNHAGSIDHRLSDPLKAGQWDGTSVCSSFVSVTSKDENDFANGLALLDANIQRLQESLHDMSEKTS